jgi:hypothetical protein
MKLLFLSLVIFLQSCAHKKNSKLDHLQEEFETKASQHLNKYKEEKKRVSEATITKDFFNKLNEVEKVLCVDAGLERESDKCNDKIISSLLAKLKEFYYLASLSEVKNKIEANPLRYKGMVKYEDAFAEIHLMKYTKNHKKAYEQIKNKYQKKFSDAKGVYCSSKKIGDEVYTRCE